MIEYPRKCPQCDYMASSPQTFFYHKRTHKPIPPGTLCCGGCGQEAKFITTNNNVWCCKEFSHCPRQAIEKSDRAAQQWDNDPQRKLNMITNGPMSSKEAREKISKAVSDRWKKKYIVTENQAPESMKQYKRDVHYASQRTYKSNIDHINPLGLQIGRSSYHLDHKVSKHVGWLLGIPVKYIASKFNLEIMPSKLNEGKGPQCSMIPSELLVACDAPIDLIEAVRSQELQLAHLIAPLSHGHRPPHGHV